MDYQVEFLAEFECSATRLEELPEAAEYVGTVHSLYSPLSTCPRVCELAVS